MRHEYTTECQGCSIKFICKLPVIIDKTPCPCIECLIKSMCHYECDEFSDYWELDLSARGL